MPIPIKLKQGTNYYQPLCYFPIGYIYLSTSNVNPGQFFGGTWEPIKDRFLLLAGDTYKGGQTGGEATHKLTIEEMPRHQPQALLNTGDSNTTGSAINWQIVNNGRFYGGDMFKSYGGDQPHNNMPPYIVVYGWVKVSN